MSIMDIFLNELSKKLEQTSTPVNEFENKKNDLILIKNIFYEHEITANEITIDNLLDFNNEEVKQILSIVLDGEKLESFYRTYSVYKPLTVTYNNIKEKFGDNFEAPQYNEAIKWLNALVKKINEYINNYEDNNQEYIDKLKEEYKTYLKFYNMFQGNALINPITNFGELYVLLDGMNFTELEKAKIKKAIGIDNLKFIEKKPVEDIITKANNILKEEEELINKASDKDFMKDLVDSINSDDNKAYESRIISILNSLKLEVNKYENAKDFEEIRGSILDNIKDYLETYQELKEKVIKGE